MLTSVNEMNAQIGLQSYIDIGKNNVTNSVFIKNVYRNSYQYQKYNIEAGIQFEFTRNNSKTLTGLDILVSKEFLIKDFTFKIDGFAMLNRFSDLMYETNYGLRIETRQLEHFLFGLGTNYKTYAINSKAIERYNIEKKNVQLSENFSLLYEITAYVKPHNNQWNAGLTCTNFDYYIINQTTNPVFNLQMKYRLESNLTLYLNTWYMQAGILNINANYFGYFLRGGIKLEL